MKPRNDLTEPLLDTPPESKTVTARVFIWSRKFFIGDYLKFKKMDKQGHVAIELPMEVSAQLIDPALTLEKRLFYLSFSGTKFGLKSKEFNFYEPDEYYLETYEASLSLNKVCDFIENKLEVLLRGEKFKSYWQDLGKIMHKEWAQYTPLECNHYLPKLELGNKHAVAGDNNKPVTRYFGALNLSTAKLSGYDNCATFAADFLVSCGADLSAVPEHFVLLFMLNTLTSAMAGFNTVSAVQLYRMYHYLEGLKNRENHLLMRLGYEYSGKVGTLSMVLGGIQVVELLLRLFVLPIFRKCNALDRLDQCCGNRNHAVYTASFFFLIQVGLTAANFYFEDSYWDNVFGMTLGVSFALAMTSLLYCLVGHFFNATTDDVNYILKPSGVGRVLRHYLWGQMKADTVAHKKNDDVSLPVNIPPLFEV